MCEALRPRRSSVHPVAAARAGPRRRSRVPQKHDQGAASDQPKIEECVKSVKEFGRETARHYTLVLLMGSVQDSPGVRDELKRIRNRACDLAVLNKSRLLPQLRREATCSEREQYEKTWNVYSACLEMLHLHLGKSLVLIQKFPLHSQTCVLIRTGVVDPHTNNGRDAITTDTAERDLHLLRRDFREISSLVAETQNKVDIKPWTFEADPETSKFYESRADSDVESANSDVVSVQAQWGPQKKKCVCLILVTLFSVIVFASVLGGCIAYFT